MARRVLLVVSLVAMTTVIALGAGGAQSAGGQLDPSFGRGGIVVTDLGGPMDESGGVVIPHDGRMAGGHAIASSSPPDRAAQAGPKQTRASYGWPVLPFHRQHPVRGLFGDPRIGPGNDGESQHTLHFGVDIVAPNGTAVYATLTGWISLHPLHRDTVMVADGAGRVFEYWHVVPAMTSGHANAYVTVIGRVEAPWGHVHFAERIGSCYLNPLRAGALGPYADVEAPRLGDVTFVRAGHDVRHVLSGNVDVIVEAFDAPALAVPAPWSAVRLTPALVRWRVIGRWNAKRGRWHIAYDVRGALSASSFSTVFVDGTRQNRTYRTGRYRFYLHRHWDTATLDDGSYSLEVSVVDIRGNGASEQIPFVVRNL